MESLTPLMHMNARIILALLMILSIFVYDPKVAVLIFLTFSIAYLILFKVVRMRIQRNGKTISEVNEKRFRLMNEGFGGIKDVLLLGRDGDFIKRFNQTGIQLAYSQGANATLGQAPKHFMELVAFGSMIVIVLYLITPATMVIWALSYALLSVYALAGLKLLPAFQLIYASTASIKGHSLDLKQFKKIYSNQ